MNAFSGLTLLLNYASKIFQDSGSDIDPIMSSILLMIVQLIGACIATFFVDKYGRRFLMILSTFGTFVSYAVIGSFTYLANKGVDVTAFNLIPILSLSTAIFCLAIGIMPLTYVIIIEIFPAKVISFIRNIVILQ